jgi:hypothetical protein
MAKAAHLRGPVYIDGDRVTITGEIKTENAQKVLYMRTMVPGTGPLEPAPTLLIPIFITFPILFSGIRATVSVARKRSRQHGEKVQGAVASEPPEDRAHKPRGVNWIINAATKSARRISPVSVVLVFIGCVLLFLGWHDFGFRKDDLFLVMFVDILIVMFLILAPIGVSLTHTSNLLEVGVNERGVHFWYETMGQRMLDQLSLPWAEIKDAGWHSAGKSNS